MHISNYKIVTRLSVGFGIVTLLTILTGITGGWGLHASSETTNRMVGQSLTKERLITEWRYDTALNGTRAMAVARNADTAEQEALAPKIKDTSSRITEIQKQLDGMPKSTAEAAMYEEIAKKRSDYLAARNEVFATKKSGNEDDAKKQTDSRLEPALDSYVAAIQHLSKLQSEEIARSTNDIGNQFSNSELVLGILTGVAFIVSVGLAVMINRSISRPLQEAINVSKAVSSGDLSTITISAQGKDELCELLWALKDMHESIGLLVGQVRTGADTIAVAAVQIADGGVNLSSRTEQQAGSLEETASTMEELTSTVKQNADNARDANQLAVSASEVAVKGGVVVSEVVGMMGSINASSKKIADIISVIDSIAFQTNILALNAAVEAARAGEQGRGFAVVAAEVRNLAQRSAAAAKEIKALIDDSVNKVESGSKLVDQAGATMDEIVASIKRVTDIVGEISTASQEQSSGIEQIGNAVMQLDEMTQQNAQLVEDSLTSTKRLQDQAAGLGGVVKSFKLHRDYEATADALVQQNNAVASKRVSIVVKTIKPKTMTALSSAHEPIHSPAGVGNDSWEEF